jgi:hypothetical protein
VSFRRSLGLWFQTEYAAALAGHGDTGKTTPELVEKVKLVRLDF